MSTPKNVAYTYLNATASTTAAKKELIAAVSGLRHRIIGLTACSAAAQNITLQSSTGGVMIGPLHLAAGVPINLSPSQIGYAETAVSRSITNQSDNATATTIHLIYQTYAATS